jgi:transcriptional regulator with XRE-family HTH domain
MEMLVDQGRVEFAARLNSSLREAGFPTTMSAFVKEYNLRADGASVTIHAARKWLSGEALPTQEKIHIIAKWLGVSAQWLRFGENDSSPWDASALEPRDVQLLNDIRALPEEERAIIMLMVNSLLKAHRYGKNK